MKTHLPIHFILFLFAWLFAAKAFSQALPDPGNDPIESIDSVIHTPAVKPGVGAERSAIKFTTSKARTILPADSIDSRIYKEEDKVNRSFK